MNSGCINRSSLVVFILLILSVIVGCEKKDYTLPVEFRMDFVINNEPILGGSVTIDEIVLSLKSIDMRGYRDLGDDVFLTRDFNEGKSFLLKPLPNRNTEVFDYPRGIYNPMLFSYNFLPDEEEEDLIEDILEWLSDFEAADDPETLKHDLGDIIEDYLEELLPCIRLTGKFSHNNKTWHLVFIVNDPSVFQIMAANKTGGLEVALRKDMINTGALQINPSYWFSVITPAMLNDAVTGIIEDDEYIFISKYINSQIYWSVVNRIEESTTLIINE